MSQRHVPRRALPVLHSRPQSEGRAVYLSFCSVQQEDRTFLHLLISSVLSRAWSLGKPSFGAHGLGLNLFTADQLWPWKSTLGGLLSPSIKYVQ